MFDAYSPRLGLSRDFGKRKRSDFDGVAEPYRVPAEQTSELCNKIADAILHKLLLY